MRVSMVKQLDASIGLSHIQEQLGTGLREYQRTQNPEKRTTTESRIAHALCEALLQMSPEEQVRALDLLEGHFGRLNSLSDRNTVLILRELVLNLCRDSLEKQERIDELVGDE